MMHQRNKSLMHGGNTYQISMAVHVATWTQEVVDATTRTFLEEGERREE